MTAEDLNLCYMSALDAVAAFKAKKLSPVELMKAIIARCEAVNPKLNVVTYSFFDRALDQAKASEARYMKTDGRVRPLEGIPFASKDYHLIKGEFTTFGSKIMEHNRATHTYPIIDRILKAGAILHLRTTTPEFGYAPVTRSLLWGISRNPWNQEYTCGGSSGGSGAAVASGMTTIADGGDGGGSIRIPASACGVFGYKPPFGRNPLDASVPYEPLIHFGVLTRTVAETALLQNIISGPHPADIYSLRTRVRIPETLEGIKGWKIGLSMDLGYVEVDEEVRRNTLKAADVFRDLGCEVEEVKLGWHSGVLNQYLRLYETLFASNLAEFLPRWRFEMDPKVVDLVERGLRLSAVEVNRVNRTRGEMYAALAPILDHYDVMICPTLAVPAVKADHTSMDPNFSINGRKVEPLMGWLLTYQFNMLSQCPVASVPTGFASSGVPTGLQIVGRTYDDISVFRAAAAFESATNWTRHRPTL
ncbi:MAG: amidase [Alphaproteobacteria bacterium]